MFKDHLGISAVNSFFCKKKKKNSTKPRQSKIHISIEDLAILIMISRAKSNKKRKA